MLRPVGVYSHSAVSFCPPQPPPFPIPPITCSWRSDLAGVGFGSERLLSADCICAGAKLSSRESRHTHINLRSQKPHGRTPILHLTYSAAICAWWQRSHHATGERLSSQVVWSHGSTPWRVSWVTLVVSPRVRFIGSRSVEWWLSRKMPGPWCNLFSRPASIELTRSLYPSTPKEPSQMSSFYRTVQDRQLLLYKDNQLHRYYDTIYSLLKSTFWRTFLVIKFLLGIWVYLKHCDHLQDLQIITTISPFRRLLWVEPSQFDLR